METIMIFFGCYNILKGYGVATRLNAVNIPSYCNDKWSRWITGYVIPASRFAHQGFTPDGVYFIPELDSYIDTRDVPLKNESGKKLRRYLDQKGILFNHGAAYMNLPPKRRRR